MNCPYCGKELHKGIIYSANPLEWRRENDEMNCAGQETVRLTGFSFFGKNIESFYCPDCRIILMPAPEKTEGAVDKMKGAWNRIQENLKEKTVAAEKQREEEREQKRKAEQRKKDPWEV
ncbi:MAG: PF20097 family protein [Eubacteriales bacterium]|nr:PF20097 family protein [Eubacteriales bacterium]